MKRDPQAYLDEILDSISRIRQYIDKVDEAEFLSNGQLQDAVVRRLEIIGEAVKSLPESMRKKTNQVPWKDIAGLRDILIHAYFQVSLKRIWTTVQDNLDELEYAVQKMKESRHKD